MPVVILLIATLVLSGCDHMDFRPNYTNGGFVFLRGYHCWVDEKCLVHVRHD